MALVTVNLIDTFDEWRIKTNTISTNSGDLTALTTSSQVDLVSAINELSTYITGKLENVVEDLTPQLGGDLDIFNANITGTGNINISGSYTGTLHADTVGVTHSTGDNSTKIATTAYVQNEIQMAPVGGDISGSIGNAQIIANVVGITELNVADGTNGQILSTDGAGNLSFIDVDLTLSGDVSGTLSNAQINANTVGVNELNASEGSMGNALVTDGAGTVSFQPVVTETTVTPTASQTEFTITYNVGRIVVFLNGVKLVKDSDFTADNGTSVTLIGGQALDTSDRVEFHVYC